jgi:hypothetical protein
VDVLAHGDAPDLQARTREEEEEGMPAHECTVADASASTSDARTPPAGLDPSPRVRFVEPVAAHRSTPLPTHPRYSPQHHLRAQRAPRTFPTVCAAPIAIDQHRSFPQPPLPAAFVLDPAADGTSSPFFGSEMAGCRQGLGVALAQAGLEQLEQLEQLKQLRRGRIRNLAQAVLA